MSIAAPAIAERDCDQQFRGPEARRKPADVTVASGETRAVGSDEWPCYRPLRIVSPANMRVAGLGGGRRLHPRGDRLDIVIRLAVSLSCSFQNTLDFRPGCRRHGAGACIFRIGRWRQSGSSFLSR